MKNKWWTLIFFLIIVVPLAVPVGIYFFDRVNFGFVPAEALASGEPILGVHDGVADWELFPSTVFFPFAYLWAGLVVADFALLGRKVFVSEEEMP